MLFQKKHLGPALILTLTLIPVLLWFPHAAFSTPSEWLRSLGQVAGITGAVLMSTNFILSARLKFLEPVFDGLNQIYIVHHIVGGLALILLLFHPLLLAFRFVPISFSQAVALLVPSAANYPVLYGIIALSILVVLLFITFYLHLKYQVWKNTHQYLGLALMFAALHVYLIPSTIADVISLRIYMLCFLALGFVSYAYRVLFGKYLVNRYLYVVNLVKQLNANVVEIILSPLSGHLSYSPGQFVFVDFDSVEISDETHPFSLTSVPGQKSLSLAVKAVGDYTQSLQLIKAGAKVRVEGPFGHFTYTRIHNHHQVWVAGGIGITPFLSMARSLAPSTPYEVHLIYSVKQPEEAVYAAELKGIAARNPNFKLTLYYSDREGRLQGTFIKKVVPEFRECDFLICGPVPMMAALNKQLIQLTIPSDRIHTEEFALN